MKRKLLYGALALLLASVFLAVSVQAPGPTRPKVIASFRVVIDGIAEPNMLKVAGIECAIQIGGNGGGGPSPQFNLTILSDCGPIVLDRALTGDKNWWRWYQDVVDGRPAARDGSIALLDQGGVEVARYNFYSALPVKYSITPLSAGTSGIVTEEIQVFTTRFERA